jgi:hypothetical protein
VFEKNCLREELLLGRIAFGKNCRERIGWGRIHREEMTIYKIIRSLQHQLCEAHTNCVIFNGHTGFVSKSHSSKEKEIDE